MTESGGLPEVQFESTAWLFRGSPLTFTEVNISAYQLLPSTLTFTDVLIGIDLVRGKMWPSEPITFWLSSKSIENRTESGGTYQRNQAFRLTTACGFFEMPRPSQMSIRTHRVILSVDVIWCLIGTDFVRGKMCLSNLQLLHSHLFSSTPCWAFPPAQHVEKNMFCHICILFVKCRSDTREDACNYTTDWYNFCIDMGFYSFCQKIFHPFRQMIFPFRLWLPSNLVQTRTSALFVYEVRSRYQKL